MTGMSEKQITKRVRARTVNNRTTTGFRISDALWEVLQPLLPTHVNTHRFGGGRPRQSDRACADAIFYVLRTGCQWQALDQTELVAHSKKCAWPGRVGDGPSVSRLAVAITDAGCWIG